MQVIAKELITVEYQKNKKFSIIQAEAQILNGKKTFDLKDFVFNSPKWI